MRRGAVTISSAVAVSLLLSALVGLLKMGLDASNKAAQAETDIASVSVVANNAISKANQAAADASNAQGQLEQINNRLGNIESILQKATYIRLPGK